jgi:hypothetical protein
METEKKVQILKDMVIFLAKVYQKNFDLYSLGHSLEVKNSMSKEGFETLSQVFQHFSTVQGTSLRELVREIAELELSSSSAKVDEMREIFDYDRIVIREKLKNRFSDENKAALLKELQIIFDKT